MPSWDFRGRTGLWLPVHLEAAVLARRLAQVGPGQWAWAGVWRPPRTSGPTGPWDSVRLEGVVEGCLEMLLCERGWVMAPHLLPCSGCPGDICDARLLGSGGEGWPLPISVSLSLTPLTPHLCTLIYWLASQALPLCPLGLQCLWPSLGPWLLMRAVLATRWPPARSGSCCIFLSPPPG